MLQRPPQIGVGVILIAACINDYNTTAPSAQHLVKPEIIEMAAIGQIDELAIVVGSTGELFQYHRKGRLTVRCVSSSRS